jgi:alkyl hydroperoxide reductase subunit D
MANTIDALIENVADYGKDIKLNFSTHVRQQTELTAAQTWGTVLASAIATGNSDLIAAAYEQAREFLSPEAAEAAKAAATIMAMNNIYYRFQHLASNKKYATIPAKLRMNAIRTHGADPVDFELWCTAVSAINGCGACVDSHEKVLREKGVGEEKILAAVRIASIVHAIASAVATEEAVPSAQPAVA